MNDLELRGNVVVPGEVVAKKGKQGAYIFKDDGELKSSVLGILESRDESYRIIPLSGRYMPKEKDMVIGIVTHVLRDKWLLDIGSPYRVVIRQEYSPRRDDKLLDLRKRFKEGDLLSVKIWEVDEVKNSMAEGPRKLIGGRVITISPRQIPRVIGSKKSMLELIRNKTGCKVNVGQNGIIWLDGKPDMMDIAVDTILKIEREAHTKKLTDRISDYLDKQIKEKKV